MVPGAVKLVGWGLGGVGFGNGLAVEVNGQGGLVLGEGIEARDEGGGGYAPAEALIEPLAEGGRQASDFTFSNHPARSIPFNTGDVKGLNAPNARKRGKDRFGQRGGASRFEPRRARRARSSEIENRDSEWPQKDHSATEQRIKG